MIDSPKGELSAVPTYALIPMLWCGGNVSMPPDPHGALRQHVT